MVQQALHQIKVSSKNWLAQILTVEILILKDWKRVAGQEPDSQMSTWTSIIIGMNEIWLTARIVIEKEGNKYWYWHLPENKLCVKLIKQIFLFFLQEFIHKSTFPKSAKLKKKDNF